MNYNDIFQCGGCEITRIRHTVSIIFINQLRDCPALWVDNKYKSLSSVLENGMGVVALD